MEMKRILKYLLCLLLVFTLIPSVVFAQDSTDTSTENEEVVTEEIGIIEEEEVIEEESDDYDVESLEDEATVVLDQYSLVTASSSNYYTFSSDTGLTELDNTITITASGTLQLLANTKRNIVIGDGTNTIDVTIDLNGFTLTGTGSTSVVLVKSYASLTLKDSSNGGTVTGGKAINGGGVSISSSATFTLESGIITGNSATYGGGVYINNATFYMNGGTISNNTAKSYGGGIEVTNGGTLILKDGTISGNVTNSTSTSNTYGGGIDIDSNGTFEMYGGSIKNNSASYGGGVYIYQNVTFKMDEGTISNNTASIRGGGICVGSEGSFVMNGGTISNNTASSRGGGVNTYGSFVMNDGKICNNRATTWGGGVQVIGNDASFIMNDGDIYENSANYGGGISVYSETASFIMNNGNIYENKALYGGAVELDISGTITINDGIIKNNIARTGGGIAIINDWGSAYGPLYFTLNGGTISGNTAYYQSGKSLSGVGGGIFLWANSATHEFIINAGNIINNIAETGSGGIHVNYNTTLTIKDVLITENSATILGGGVYNCEKGNTYTYITDGAAIFDNSSTSAQDSTLVAAGDDFTNLYDSSFGDTEIKLSSRILGGGSIDYYYDGGIQYYKVDDSMGDYQGQGDLSEISRYPDSDKYEFSDNDGNYIINQSIALKSIVLLDQSKELAKTLATTVITGNSGQWGGGIGNNGTLVLGDSEAEENLTTLKVSKVWNDDGVLEHNAITVGLYTVAGDDYYLIDTVELSDDNDWTYTFTDLASNLDYKILEEELENYTVDYEYINNDYDITVTITNTPITEVQDENIEICEDGLETDEPVDVGTEPTTNNTSDEVDTETFDHTIIMLYSVLGLLALTGIYTVIKRRKEI